MTDFIFEERLRLTIPGKPGHWRRARVSTRSGRPIQFQDDKTRDWEASVSYAAASAMRGAKPISKPCQLLVEFYIARPSSKTGLRKWLKDRGLAEVPVIYPHDSTPDLDNYVKGIKDGMTKACAWTDDKICCELAAKKWWCAPGRERVEIAVWEMEVLLRCGQSTYCVGPLA